MTDKTAKIQSMLQQFAGAHPGLIPQAQFRDAEILAATLITASALAEAVANDDDLKNGLSKLAGKVAPELLRFAKTFWSALKDEPSLNAELEELERGRRFRIVEQTLLGVVGA
jgi:hypothetical protein